MDLVPKDSRVMPMDVNRYLEMRNSNLEEIKTSNLLEHLDNVGYFLSNCYKSLKPGGVMRIKTDNAEWLPFYLPIDIPHTGVGAHAMRSYSGRFNSYHTCIFTKMHLSILLEKAGFRVIEIKRVALGSRLLATVTKPL